MAKRFDEYSDDSDEFEDDEYEDEFEDDEEELYEQLEIDVEIVKIFGHRFGVNIIKKLSYIYEQSAYILSLLQLEKDLILKEKKDTKEYEENNLELIEALNYEKELYLNFFNGEIYLINEIIEVMNENNSDRSSYMYDNKNAVFSTNILNNLYSTVKLDSKIKRMENYFYSLTISERIESISQEDSLVEFWIFDELRYLIKKIDDFSINFGNNMDKNLFTEMKQQYESLKVSILFYSNIITNNYILGEKLVGFDFAYDNFFPKNIYDKEILKFKNSYNGYLEYKSDLNFMNILTEGIFDLAFYYQTLIEYNLSNLSVEQLKLIVKQEQDLQETKKLILNAAYKNSINKKLRK